MSQPLYYIAVAFLLIQVLSFYLRRMTTEQRKISGPDFEDILEVQEPELNLDDEVLVESVEEVSAFLQSTLEPQISADHDVRIEELAQVDRDEELSSALNIMPVALAPKVLNLGGKANIDETSTPPEHNAEAGVQKDEKETTLSSYNRPSSPEPIDELGMGVLEEAVPIKLSTAALKTQVKSKKKHEKKAKRTIVEKIPSIPEPKRDIAATESPLKRYSRSFKECTKAPLIPQDRRLAPKETLTITTWNVLRLFQKNLNSGCPGPNCKWKNQAMVDLHYDAVARTSYATGTDILVYQEVEDCDSIIEINRRIRKLFQDDTYRAYLIRGNDIRTGQNIGFLARVDPMEDLKPITLSPEDLDSRSKISIAKSAVYRFQLANNPKPFTLLGVHLVGHPGVKARDEKRDIQAQILRTYIEKYVPETDRLIVAGDFNDMSVKCSHRANSVTSSNVFKIINGIRHNGTPLENAQCKAMRRYRYTTFFERENEKGKKQKLYQAFDHILLDRNSARKLKYVSYGHGLFDEDDIYHSDHYPVSIRLELTKAQKQKPAPTNAWKNSHIVHKLRVEASKSYIMKGALSMDA